MTPSDPVKASITQDEEEARLDGEEGSFAPIVSLKTYYGYFKAGMHVLFVLCLAVLFVITQGKKVSLTLFLLVLYFSSFPLYFM